MNCWSHWELRRWRNGSLQSLRGLSFLGCSVERRCLQSTCIGYRMKTQICRSISDAWMASFNCLTAIISWAAAAEPPAKTKRSFHQVKMATMGMGSSPKVPHKRRPRKREPRHWKRNTEPPLNHQEPRFHLPRVRPVSHPLNAVKHLRWNRLLSVNLLPQKTMLGTHTRTNQMLLCSQANNLLISGMLLKTRSTENHVAYQSKLQPQEKPGAKPWNTLIPQDHYITSTL